MSHKAVLSHPARSLESPTQIPPFAAHVMALIYQQFDSPSIRCLPRRGMTRGLSPLFNLSMQAISQLETPPLGGRSDRSGDTVKLQFKRPSTVFIEETCTHQAAPGEALDVGSYLELTIGNLSVALRRQHRRELSCASSVRRR